MITKVYIACADSLTDSEKFKFLYSKQPNFRQKKIDAAKFDSDKRLILCASELMRTALGEYDLNSITYSPHGKPQIDGVEFNISHSGRYALCAVADEPIGADIQQLQHATPALINKAFSIAEQSEIHTDRDFCTHWAIKESYLKCTGVGLQGINDCTISTTPHPHIVGHSEYSIFTGEVDEHFYSLCIKHYPHRNIDVYNIVI